MKACTALYVYASTCLHGYIYKNVWPSDGLDKTRSFRIYKFLEVDHSVLLISAASELFYLSPISFSMLAEHDCENGGVLCCLQGLRPTIPKHTNPKLAELLEKCWQQDPAQRPDFSEILEMLQLLAKEVE